MYSLNNRILKLIPFVFLLLVIAKIIYTYYDIKEQEYEFAHKEAQVLNSYTLESRDYYRTLFLDKTLELNEKTISALPAFNQHIISERFSNNNPLNVSIRTVSDRARNIKNQATPAELKAINAFKANPNLATYFQDEDNQFYQYATVLKIEKSCMACHGKKEDAPPFIQKNYANAYGYKLGEIRGIISIKIPMQKLHEHFFANFFASILYDILFLALLFLGTSFIIRKSKNLNDTLEKKVRLKTDELTHSFFYDKLTKLPNRQKLLEEIDGHEGARPIHLALINIDAFRDVNNLHGYEAGDELLRQVADKLQLCCKTNYSLYKLPSDEFAVLSFDNIAQQEFLETIQETLVRINETKFDIMSHEIFISFSCGIASNESAILLKANTALQTAKQHAKTIVIYDSGFDTKEQITKNSKILTMLKQAIKKGNVKPFFQPIYNAKTKKIEKYESLVRIVKDDGEVVSPFVFLDVAMRAKLYPEITKTMIEQSFEMFKDKPVEFSINLSILDIQNPDTTAFIIQKLKEFSEPTRVVFEILEGDKIENYEEIKGFIRSIKAFGVKFAIDDFGSGYSNFSHIFELNIDYLKIDGSLVKFISSDENSRVIVKTIINFATNLGLKTIAEFVEDKDSFDLLQKMGVDFVQGYYVGKPQPSLLFGGGGGVSPHSLNHSSLELRL